MTSRRDFIRTGALWTLGAAIIGPEALERLNWRRKSFALGAVGPRVWDVRTSSEFVSTLPRMRPGDVMNLLEPITITRRAAYGGMATNVRSTFFPGLVNPHGWLL